MLTSRPTWRISVLPIGALSSRKPPMWLILPEPGLQLPQDSLSKHTKGFLGISEVILSSSAAIIASSLGVQVGGLSEVRRQRWGYGKVRERVFYK